MSSDHRPVAGVIVGASVFEAEAHALLEAYEDAHHSRVTTLGTILGRLSALNLRQENLFRQALRCAQNEIYLAAHVMAWAALMDLYEEKLGSDSLKRVHSMYPKWQAHTTIDTLRENVKEFQLIEAGKKSGLLSHSNMKSLHGHLHTRNQAAHPTDFDPGINETLGYIEALLKLAGAIERKSF